MMKMKIYRKLRTRWNLFVEIYHYLTFFCSVFWHIHQDKKGECRLRVIHSQFLYVFLSLTIIQSEVSEGKIWISICRWREHTLTSTTGKRCYQQSVLLVFDVLIPIFIYIFFSYATHCELLTAVFVWTNFYDTSFLSSTFLFKYFFHF